MKRRRALRRFGGRIHPVYWMGGTPANTTSETTTNLSPELAAQIGPFADFARKEVARPYKPYKGQLVAGFNPDQYAAFNLGRQGSGAYGQYGDLLAQGPFQGGIGASENEADSYLRNILSGGNISAQETEASNYLSGFFDPNRQNPYFEEQLGIGRRRIGEEYEESIAPGLAGKYAMAGAFGGTAASEAEGRSQRELGRTLGEYETGSRSAEQERRYAQGLQAAGLVEGTAGRRAGQGLQASGQIEGTAARRASNSLMDAQLRSGIIGQQEGAFQNDFTRLLGIGAQEQEQTQKFFNSKYEQFLRKQAYPRQTFDLYRDAIAALTGAGGGGSSQSGTSAGGGPGDAQLAAGAATTAASLYALYQVASAAGSAGGCWVAREVFGERDPRWVRFRYWLLTRSPKWFRSLYMRYGKLAAAFVKSHPWLKPPIRKWMEARIEAK